MNNIVPIKEEMTLPHRFGLVPSNMDEAMKLAEMMATARLVPAALQKSPADCLMVIQQAIRWDMDPFAVAQECSVIQGKLMHSGKLVAAVVNARGNLTQRLSFEYKGDGDNRTITVSGQLQGEPAPRVVEVILKNAKTQNTMWQKQVDQQLMYHGTRVWARRHTPELMLGVYSPEEFDEPTQRRPIAAPNVMIPHDKETGEIIDLPPPPPQVQEAEPTIDFSAANDTLTEAASHGMAQLKTAWQNLDPEERSALKEKLDDHKRAAEEVDANTKPADEKKPRGRPKLKTDTPVTVTLPPAGDLTVGSQVEITNKSDAPVTVRSGGTTTVIPPALKPTASPRPKNSDEYKIYMQGWLATMNTKADIEDRWRQDRGLRGECGVIEEKFAALRTIKEARVTELEKGVTT